MRIHIKTSSNREPVPFDHLHLLVGAFHKWLGENEVHGDLSLYSLSWLKGAKAINGELSFSQGASFFISAHDDLIIKRIISGVRSSPETFCGMLVKEVSIQATPSFENLKSFGVNSPVLVKTLFDGKQKHLTYEDPESSEILTSVFKRKLLKAGLDDSEVNVAFDRTYFNPKTKLINYRGIGNKANICPVIVEGSPEQLAFAWNVGIGHSTGIGFGALN
ncbi:CRISPR-associated endoribonuclease Cas6 [Dyadobacter luteus]|uniref:CRISPR-associated endoribonuclease Cas6 n=1 Tax=Dyadobacter luteus TaxID=2259619 RepID=A0A3D8Y6E7_9BACT|nr:CRISPR-associated endoribonuclease Cas6 [Dyadobacter luteus]REA58459.1 CRISPR-associated endoribonuclease Cas6 [Dyadobacter luteus]